MCCPFAKNPSPTVGRESFMVDGAASEWIPIISGVPHACKCVLFILYTSKMFELVENRPFAYADDATLLAVVRKPADRPVVAGPITWTWLCE